MNINATPVAFWSYENASPVYDTVFFEIEWNDGPVLRDWAEDAVKFLCKEIGAFYDNKIVLQMRPQEGPDFFLQWEDGNLRLCTAIQPCHTKELPAPRIDLRNLIDIPIDELQGHLEDDLRPQ